MRRLGVTIGAGLTLLVAAVAAQAMAHGNPDPATGVHLTPLSTGTFGSSVRADGAGTVFKTHGPKEMLTSAITVDPGSTGHQQNVGSPTMSCSLRHMARVTSPVSRSRSA